MIVDSSVLMAVLLREPEEAQFTDLLGEASGSLMSAGTWIELTTVVCRRLGPASLHRLDALMAAYRIEIYPVTVVQARIGHDAYLRYGRGIDPIARLNFGDCFSYALAKEVNQPLLFKGDDFTHTDVKQAIPR